MSITVNGVEITDAAVEHILPQYEDSPTPTKAAAHALVLKQILLQRASELKLDQFVQSTDEGTVEDAIIDQLLAQEISTPETRDEECERYYQTHSDQFIVGELIEASHILFQVTPSVPLDGLRAKAEEVLATVLANPEQFEEVARNYSNCPSAAQGGNLGQLSRGQTVPEFEKAAFQLADGEISPRVIETRFGFHIIQVAKHIPGQQMPFAMVKEKIADYLQASVYQRAVHQYLKLLVGKADIQGIEMEGALSPLMQ